MNYLYEYIYYLGFRKEIFKELDIFIRFFIKQELNFCIDKIFLDWQKKYFDDIFQKIIMRYFLKKFENIYRFLYLIKDILKGF